jgi:hypothetical protein
MYASPAREHERIELEKARLELEQQSRAKVSGTPRREDYLRSRFSATDIPMKEETPRLIACVPRC